MYALNLGENNRVLSACICLPGQTYETTVDALPEGDVYEYRYENGEFIHDPLPKPDPPKPDPPKPDPTGSVTYDELAAAIQEGVNNYGK